MAINLNPKFLGCFSLNTEANLVIVMSHQKISTNPSKKSLKCTICRSDIEDISSAYQPLSIRGVICKKCHSMFSEQDIELNLALILAYGGYFGEYEKKDFSIIGFIKEIVDDLNVSEISVNVEELNYRLLHRALLHGIDPSSPEYEKRLKILLQDNSYNYFI